MNHRIRILVFSTVLVISLAVLMSMPSRIETQSAELLNVDPAVLQTIREEGVGEFIIVLKEQADLSAASVLGTKVEKGQFVYNELTKTASQSQASLISELEKRGVSYQAFWIANMVLTSGEEKLLTDIAAREEVKSIHGNPQIRFSEPEENEALFAPVDSLQWNIEAVQAQVAWSNGIEGQGVVIGGQDTGFEWDHPALIDQYRGWDGQAADHNYNWHDAVHANTNIACPPDSNQPCDDHGHGTHVIGTAVGDGGPGNKIGVAPGAQWIGCRNMNMGVGTPATYTECYQWFLAPTDLNNQNPDPSLAPDIINNSWSCPVNEGCIKPGILKDVVENVRAAGILTVQSAGNSGPSCETVNEPAAIYDASFTVGATDQSGLLASFSSRGPVAEDGSSRIKPDISAPGVLIRSSSRNGDYGYSSGTSMSAPHVSGVAALLISEIPSLRGSPSEIEVTIINGALPKAAAISCGLLPAGTIPNNSYGYGIVNYSTRSNFIPLIRSAGAD